MSDKTNITFEDLKACAERAASATSFTDGVNTERWSNEFDRIQDCTFMRLAFLYRCRNNGKNTDEWTISYREDEIQKDYERQMIV